MRSSPGLKTSGYFDHGSVFIKDILQLVLKPRNFAKNQRVFSEEADILGPYMPARRIMLQEIADWSRVITISASNKF
jgi:hypothetical protein